MSGRDLAHAVDQLVKLQLRPQLKALDREGATAERQGAALAGRANDYYRQLAEREAGTVARQQALASMTNSNLASIAAGTQQQIGQAGDELQQRQAADAELRGPGLGGGPSRAADELAAQRANAVSSAQAFRSAGELQGANYESLALSNRTARGHRGGEVQEMLANRLADTLGEIRGKRSDVAASRGPLATKTLLDLRQSGFENVLAAEGLGIDRAKLAADIQSDKADRKLAKAKLRLAEVNAEISAGNLSERRRHNLVSERNDLRRILNDDNDNDDGSANRPTPTQRRGYRQDYHQALSLVQSDPKWKPGKADQFVQALTAKGYPREIAIAAVYRAAGRPVPPRVRRTLRRWGVKVPSGDTGGAGGILGDVQDTVGGLLG